VITNCISLIGFSATGKSTVAGLVAERLGWPSIDSDTAIEEDTNTSVPELLSREGEATFRALESVAVNRILSARGEGLVLSLGGGATLTRGVRMAIAAAGLIVCLEATPATILQRLVATEDQAERPILAGGIDRIRRLKAERAALYALADFTAHTDGRAPADIADAIVRFCREDGDAVLTRPGRALELSEAPANLPILLDAPDASAIVRAASASYPAYVTWGGLDDLGEQVRRATGARRAFVITDRNVQRLWGERAISNLKAAGLEVASLALAPGDASKSLEAAATIYDWLGSERAERRDALVALGGGMVGDLTGFIAATYMRGVPFVQVPTSLLAMVDASIGGKTAVNHGQAKNLVGSFYQPRAVIADVALLKTLPRRELVEGFGEVVKHALIRDPELLDLLEARLDEILALDAEITTQVIRRNIQIKAAVVSEDERETGGVREILNYGHTLGHAFETAGDYESLLHGEAVALGMIAAAAIGERVGVTPSALVERQNRLIERTGLPVKLPAGLDRDRILGALSLDKKVVAGKQRWVLLEAEGRTTIKNDVPVEIVIGVVDEMLAG
jgi:shikimate kinase/3-dehydroquinate synthase